MENNLNVDYVMTPLNPLGYQMTLSKEDAERAIVKLSTWGTKVMAINILASGTVGSMDEVVSYLKQFRDYTRASAVGTSKPQRAIAVLGLLRNLTT